MVEPAATSAGAFGPGLARFLRLGVAAIAGTVDSNGRSEGVRSWGLVPQPDDQTLTMFIPEAHAARTLANLRANRRIAVTCSLPTTYETYQIKGDVLGMRAGRDAERPIVEMYREAFLAETAAIGFTEEFGRTHYWPVVALVISVQQVFRQTPAPGTGELLERDRGASRDPDHADSLGGTR